MEESYNLDEVKDYETARILAGINAVCWLHEYCSLFHHALPVYETRSQLPVHMSTCRLGAYISHGKANTESEAKNMAAAKMLNALDPQRKMLTVKARDRRCFLQQKEAAEALTAKELAKEPNESKLVEASDDDLYAPDESDGRSLRVVQKSKFGPVDWTIKSDPEDVPTKWQLLELLASMKQIELSVISKDKGNGTIMFVVSLGDSSFCASGYTINEAREAACEIALKYYDKFNEEPASQGPLTLPQL